MKRNILILLLFLSLYLCHMASAEGEIFDHRTDIHSFGHKIAEMNISLTATKIMSGRRSQPKYMILFQATGPLPDFRLADFEPIQIVYGPRGYSAMICTNPEAAMEWLSAQDGIRHVELDAEIRGCSERTENETGSFYSWGAELAAFGDYAAYAENWGNGSCTVAVIDSGVYGHSLIQPKMRSTGHDYIDNDEDPTNDLNGHGTRVAGIVADCTRNQPVFIHPIRVLDADANGRTSNVISAVVEATASGVDIINLSLSTFSRSEMLESAIRDAIAQGIIVVAAAGNYACDASEVTPGCMTDTGIIVVGSAEADGSRSSFSNYGASVDLYFYGRNIMSCSRTGGYVTDTGTSMAAPHISAMGAMIRLIHPGISAGTIVDRIRYSFRNGKDVLHAGGMVPRERGFRMDQLYLRTGEKLTFPKRAAPDSAMEEIIYTIADPQIVSLDEEGQLTATAAGETRLTAECKGFPKAEIRITVAEGATTTVRLPEGLETIGEEAFFGIQTDHVYLPAEVRAIRDRAFDGGRIRFIHIPNDVAEIGINTFSGAVILCSADSNARTYVQDQELPYLLIEP